MKIHKLLTTTLFFLSITFLSATNLSSEEKTDPDTIHYTITIDEAQPKVAKMNVTFIPKNDTLYMHWGASQLPKRWATFVQNVNLKDSSGENLKIEELDGAEWFMHHHNNQRVTLSYEVHLNHEEHQWSGGIDGVAFATELGVFYTGRTLLILNGESWRNIKVHFNLPKKWNVSTPWKTTSAHKHSYRPTTYSDLIDAMIFAGTHKEVSLKRSDFELVFALGTTDIIHQEEEFKNLAEGVLDYYIDLMGGIPNPSPDNPFHKAVVVICSAETTDGEAIGNNISILIQKDGDQFSNMISRFIFAHEFFHLWNGKSFIPEGINTEWFKEGFSNYYTIKALHHVGFLNDASYLNFLSNFFYQRYSNDPGVGELSMTDGNAKHEHWGLIYGGGMLVGIAQDILIRNATNNEKSIDDLLRHLYQQYGGTNNNYNSEELLDTMTKLSNVSQQDFYNSYILGTQKIPIDTYLNMAGLNAVIQDGQLNLSIDENASAQEKSILKGVFGAIK